MLYLHSVLHLTVLPRIRQMTATALHDNSGKNNLILPILKPHENLCATLCHHHTYDPCMDLRLANKQTKILKGDTGIIIFYLQADKY